MAPGFRVSCTHGGNAVLKHRESIDDSAAGFHPEPLFRAAGEGGIVVEFGSRADLRINDAVLAFERAVRAAVLPGVIETAPAIRSVLVRFDPLAAHPRTVERRLRELLAAGDWRAPPPPAGRARWRVPAAYGGRHGPDLAEVADWIGATEAAAVESHAAALQRVLTIGFAPGQPYLGLLGDEWDIPRLAEIKPRVPAGAVSVAVRQTVLYPAAAPTGWRTIARSPFRCFMPTREAPFALRPGDEVVFEPIAHREFDSLARRAARGEWIAVREDAR